MSGIITGTGRVSHTLLTRGKDQKALVAGGVIRQYLVSARKLETMFKKLVRLDHDGAQRV